MTSLSVHQDHDVLIVVDVQNDFCEGGALAVPGAREIIPSVNAIATRFEHVVLTQDWHPIGHLSFASSHVGRGPFETISLPYGPQILWPDHCIQETPGAAFHRDMQIPHAELVLRKGIRRAVDSYSTFFENDRTTPTGLMGYLRERQLGRIFLAGLAYDFCVRYSAEDAIAAGLGVIVLENACRSIDVGGSADGTRRSFSEKGIISLMWEQVK